MELIYPYIFAFLLGLAILIYVILDGFDLGVGLLLAFEKTQEGRDTMVASIGPFWDANETWLVLAVGLLLVAFPFAHGMILTALYIPVFFMLVGLMIRGAAFELRVKMPEAQRPLWDGVFFGGSLLTSFSQGFMLGLYVMGLVWSYQTVLFAILVGVSMGAAYALMGASWLLGKTAGALQARVAQFGRPAVALTALGFALISLGTPAVSQRVFDLWFSIPNIFLLGWLPLAALGLLLFIWRQFGLGSWTGLKSWRAFAASALAMALAYTGLAISFFPYIVPDKLLIVEAASDTSALFVILMGALGVLPIILGYTIYAYWLFRGKARSDGYRYRMTGA